MLKIPWVADIAVGGDLADKIAIPEYRHRQNSRIRARFSRSHRQSCARFDRV
jgi:hypothetical protein